MAQSSESRLLVTGAGGRLGRRVVELLLESGARNVVAASRHPAKLGGLAARGAVIRAVDFDDTATLSAAFAGIDRALIISTDALGVPGLRKRQHRAAVNAAVAAGVRHIVYTSMLNPEPASLIPFASDHYATEQAIETAGVDSTILRNCWYSESLCFSLPGMLASGRWITAAGQGRISYVAREDAARAASAALASNAGGRRRYDITGPQSLTPHEIGSILAEVFRRPIAVVPVSDDQLARNLASAGIQEAYVPLLVASDASIRAGRFDVVSDAVERLTGKPPQSLREFMMAHRAAFDISSELR